MRRVVFLLYPGFQVLDLAGAAAVFAGAERQGAPLYQVVCASITGGPVLSGAGVTLETGAADQMALGAADTVIVPGAGEHALHRAMADTALTATLKIAAAAAGRLAAVCTGSFLLAAAGLLDGKRAATHWATSAAFAAAFPRVTLLPEPIFVADDGIWTSAGTTTGIDMALDIVKQDHGNAPAHDVARQLRGRRARARLNG